MGVIKDTILREVSLYYIAVSQAILTVLFCNLLYGYVIILVRALS